MTELIEITKAFGLPVALLCYFMLRDHRREKRDLKSKDKLIERINKIEDFQIHEMRDLTVQTTVALKESTTVMKENTTAMIRISEAMRARPCIADNIHNIERRQ